MGPPRIPDVNMIGASLVMLYRFHEDENANNYRAENMSILAGRLEVQLGVSWGEAYGWVHDAGYLRSARTTLFAMLRLRGFVFQVIGSGEPISYDDLPRLLWRHR